ncbi:MAG: NAD-dependent epimerase/dehydratase family protein [Patescibacteria group bacterium]
MENDFTDIAKKDFLITGASGLLGTYFLACIKLLRDNDDDKNFGNIFAVMLNDPPDYLADLYKDVLIIKGDLSDYNFCQSLPSADYIIHAAGYGQPGRFMEDQVKTLKINTLATFSLLEKIKNNGNFLFLSTSELYSGLRKDSYNETDIGNTNTDHFRSCYIEGKRCGEAICNAHRLKGVSAKSARLALAYGPGTRVHDKRVLNSFIEKAIINSKIDLLDQGEAKRTYCYVSDAVEIMLNILLRGKESIYNVGGISQTTIRDLAINIGEQLSVPVVFPEETGTSVNGAPDDVKLNLDRVANEFGKKKFVSLKEGLAKTIEWQKNIYNLVK